MDQGFKKSKRVHPKESANFFSLITFFYNWELFKTGWKKDLETSDLYEVVSSCKSKDLGDKLEQAYLFDKKENGKASLVRVLWKCFGKTYIIFGIVQLVMRTVFVIFVPEALGKLVSYFAEGQTSLTKNDAILYAAILIGLNVIQCFYTQNYMFALTEFGIKVRTAICSFIYRKSTRLTETALAEFTMGKIITLLTKDLFALEMLIQFGNDIWIGIVQTIIISILIYLKIGVSTFSGVGFFLTVIPLQIFIGKLAMVYRLRASKKTDERLCQTQEMISSIKIIKMYGWEKFFSKRITNTRKKEVRLIYILYYLKIIIVIIGGLSSKIAFYLLIMTYVWLGNNVTAEIVYFVTACFGKLKFLLSFMLPLGISFGAESFATILRIDSLLESEELPLAQNNNCPVKAPSVKLQNVALKIQNNQIFTNLNIEIDQGLYIVVGHLGAGKSTFFKTILECFPYNGTVTVSGRVSYSSQEPWLFPSSIRNNILFGSEYKKDRYEKVLKVCDLRQDFKTIPDKDQTIVGDRGVNLSKGQQARINLARAVYKEADIYLLDDCLSALDAHVSDFVFEKCIKEFLSDKLVLFVTNHHQHIKQANRIIKIENGAAQFGDSTAIDKLPIDTLETEVVNEENDHKEPEILEKTVYNEEKSTDNVNWMVFKRFVQYGGGFCALFGIILLFIITQSAVSYSEKVISNWVTVEQNLTTYNFKNLNDTNQFNELNASKNTLINLYTILIGGVTALALIKCFCFFAFNRNVSINSHKKLLSSVANAKMTFFDSHFLGTILNRFAKDICTLDDHLPFVVYECFELLFFLAGIIILIAAVNTIFLIPAGIFIALAIILKQVYQRTGKSLQRLEASSRSPLMGHINASFDGLTTIRAYRTQDLIIEEFDKHQDLYTSANYMLQNSLRALMFCLDAMCAVFIAIIISYFLAMPLNLTVGGVGLAITQAMHLCALLQHGIRRLADCENQMISVQRLLEYSVLPQEERTGARVNNWPKSALVQYENVSLDYESRSKVLNNVNFTVAPTQKIGIVGRTGSGKSSIMAALFRLYEVQGKIRIDNVDIREVDLDFLRSQIGIIPQDPVLFACTIRENIDPMNRLRDEEIWTIFKTTQLDSLITNLGDSIDSKRNFTSGQKQLFCLARAIAKKAKIVVLDEATSNLDKETDLLVRKVIDENFKNCTTFVIAHRLSSVLASDRVMVVENGEIVEFDTPEKLLADKNSLFSEMVKNDE